MRRRSKNTTGKQRLYKQDNCSRVTRSTTRKAREQEKKRFLNIQNLHMSQDEHSDEEDMLEVIRMLTEGVED